MPVDFLNRFMDQYWEHLLLLHWPVEKESIMQTLPDDLQVDLFDKQAWVSVVGFKLSGLRISPVRWIKWPDFWEINLRTYVKDRSGKKGIWFYSLDSSDIFAVTGARLLYGLDYNFANTFGAASGENISFISERKFPHRKAKSVFSGKIKSSEDSVNFVSSALDKFLLERYRFWTKRKHACRSETGCVQHIPYKAIKVSKPKYSGELFTSQGMIEPQNDAFIGHYCRGMSVQATAPSWAFSMAGQANQM